MDGVVPGAVPVVGGEGHGGKFLVGDFDAAWVVALAVGGVDLQGLDLKDDSRAYTVKRTPAGNIIYQGLSARALHLAREALDAGLDVDAAVDRYNSRSRS